MRRFNLSGLSNRPLVLFAMLAFALIGAWSYKHLGQSGSTIHLQGDGGAHAVAGRHRRAGLRVTEPIERR